MNCVKAFSCFETVSIGIFNPRTIVRFTGPPDQLEMLIAFAVQTEMEVNGLTDEERDKYLKMDLT